MEARLKLGTTTSRPEKRSPLGPLQLGSSAESAVLYVFAGIYKLVFYSEALERIVAKNLVLEQIMNPPDSVFIGHVYVQPADA